MPTEAAVITDRRCRLTKENRTGWFVLRFEKTASAPQESPRRVLPCGWLEDMESRAAEDPDIVFVLTGETTVFGRNCFILPSAVGFFPGVRPRSRPSNKQTTSKPAAKKSTSVPTSSSAPSSRPSVGDTRSDPSAIADRLLSMKPSKPVLRKPNALRRLDTAPSVAPLRAKPLPPSRPSMVVDRLAHILAVPADKWWEARFLSDNTLREEPLRLLPNKMLERAIRLAGRNSDNPRTLRISGLITLYKGRRYLLLRKVLRKRDMGQF